SRVATAQSSPREPKADIMSEVRPQLLITLVHGTWGRGFFPRQPGKSRRPFWFEEGSPFLARISGELSDVPHKIWPLLWSGANSIYIRDKTAQACVHTVGTLPSVRLPYA